MVDLSSFVDLTNPSTVLAWAALILAAATTAVYLRGRSEARFRARELELLSRAVEQVARLSVLEYGGITRLGQSLARALNPTGDTVLESPDAEAAWHALGREPERILEEAELVLAQAARTFGWKRVPGVRES